MANRSFYPSVSYGVGRVYMEFGFVCNGASGPVTTSVFGGDMVSSFAHTGATNIITVTLKDAFAKVIFISADVTSATDGDYCTIKAISNEGTATPLSFQILYFVAAGTAKNDPPSTSTTRVNLTLRNSTLTGNGA